MVTASKRCRDKFEEWAIKALLIKEGEDYEFDPAWESWKRAWARAQSYGAELERQKQREYNKPLTEEEIKELWNRCGTGKSFARMIESKHGIR